MSFIVVRCINKKLIDICQDHKENREFVHVIDAVELATYLDQYAAEGTEYKVFSHSE